MGIGAPDSYQLVSPQGSNYELASYIRAEDGPDFGDAWMAAHYAENPAADGAQFAFESIGLRTMSFPLLVPSSPSGIDYRIQQLTLAARPGGAYLDLLPFGATSAVRFDIAGPGRWKPDYHIRHQEAGRRMGTLEFDVEPLGYLPTLIVLGSAASIGLPGNLTIDTTLLIGDAPGLVDLTIQPTLATTYGNTAQIDGLMFSLAARPSFVGFIPAASLTSQSVVAVAPVVPTLTGDGFAPGSQAYQLLAPDAFWNSQLQAIIPTALEPAYRGRHRLWLYARLSPSNGVWQNVTADVVSHPSVIGKDGANYFDLASAAPVSTVVANAASDTGLGAVASKGYQMVDLGEITLPAQASGASAWSAIRIWNKEIASTAAVATPLLSVAGLWLQPLDGPAAALTSLYYAAAPAAGGPIGGLQFHADFEDRLRIELVNRNEPVREGMGFFRGALPRTGASTIGLAINALDRAAANVNPTAIPARQAKAYALARMSYRPRFTFARSF